MCERVYYLRAGALSYSNPIHIDTLDKYTHIHEERKEEEKKYNCIDVEQQRFFSVVCTYERARITIILLRYLCKTGDCVSKNLFG